MACLSFTTKERPLPDEPAGHDGRPEWLTKSTTPTFCYRHPDRQTGRGCSRRPRPVCGGVGTPGPHAGWRCSLCAGPICGQCATPAPVGQLCPDDARATVRVRGLPGSERPLATRTLLGINTLMLFAAAALSGSAFGLLDPSARALCRLGGLNAAAIAGAGRRWRLLTVMVLHGGLLHWAFNSWALWPFGP